MAERFVTRIFDPSERQEAGVTITETRTAIYTLVVDWANNGTFTDTYDDVTSDVLATAGVVIERGRDQQRANGDVMVPAATFTLSNVTGTYNPQRGPLSSQLIPGRPVKISASFGSPISMSQTGVAMSDAGLFTQGESAVNLFRGVIDDMTFNPDIGARTVEFRALGRLLRLRGVSVVTQLYNNITTGTAMAALLNAAGLSVDEYVVDQSATANGRLLRYWWADGDAYDAAVQLLETEGPPAALYEDGSGRIVFEGHLFRSLTPRATTIQGWYRDTDADGFYLTYSSLRYGPGLRDIVNDVAFVVDTRTPDSVESVVWEYKETLEHLPLNSVSGTRDSNKLVVVAHTDDPFYDAQVPSAAAGDFTLAVRQQAAGEFWPAVPTTIESIELSQTSGTSTTITFTTTGKPSIQGLRLRAKSVPLTSSVTVQNVNTAEAIVSKTRFGKQTATPNVFRTITRNDAELLADAIVNQYANIRPTATITVLNINNAHVVQQLTREVSDRIHLIAGTLGIDDDYTVEQITHEIKESGTHTVTLGLERAQVVPKIGTWLAFGTSSVWGANSTTPSVGYWG